MMVMKALTMMSEPDIAYSIGSCKKLTSHIKARDSYIRRATKELWGEGLNAIAHGGDGVGVDIVEAGHGGIVALSWRTDGTRVEFAFFGEGGSRGIR